ncbi:MAG TPA: hypothetical protein VFA09_12400 [Ktedonobacteraceae bacterium]|nr:hypothetical protein [Ktedonobacteraceae bacterium]
MPEKVLVTTGKKRVDPLVQYYGSPILENSDIDSAYLGRVIIELYRITRLKEKLTDANSLRCIVGPSNRLTEDELVQRIAAAFPLRVASSRPSNAVIGPLARYKLPIIGEDSPDDRYLGRVIIELYGTPGLQALQIDADNLRYAVDAANGITESELKQRIATAFPLRAKSLKH